jgi:hypothetical protein
LLLRRVFTFVWAEFTDSLLQVINVLGKRQQPIQNFVFFDGHKTESPMFALHPGGVLGEQLLPVPTPAEVQALLQQVSTGPQIDLIANGVANGGEQMSVD